MINQVRKRVQIMKNTYFTITGFNFYYGKGNPQSYKEYEQKRAEGIREETEASRG